MLEFYNKYFKGDSLSASHSDFALHSICYELAADRLMYLWKKRMKGEPVTPDSAYLKFVTPSFIENRQAFITPSYIRFINLYLSDTYERMVESGKLPVNRGEALVPSIEKYKLAHQLFNPPFRDAVLYNLIINDMNDVTDREIRPRPETAGLDSLTTLFEKKYLLN